MIFLNHWSHSEKKKIQYTVLKLFEDCRNMIMHTKSNSITYNPTKVRYIVCCPFRTFAYKSQLLFSSKTRTAALTTTDCETIYDLCIALDLWCMNQNNVLKKRFQQFDFILKKVFGV